jgi:succinate dehydrogenase/fumarate reductase flavoprotein subunit
MLLTARMVTEAALMRRESRGAHQREDAPDTLAEWELNQVASWRDGALAWARRPRAKAQAA